MVFCSTRRNTDFIAKNLVLNGINANEIHGGLDQNKRIKVLKEFHEKRTQCVLVCTDVAARGLDIKNVSHVYNYPAPLDWTNQKSVGVISRAQGAQLTWTGGDADGVVAIRGTSFAAPGSPTPSASFMCSVPASIGEFTVPASVLQTLPVGAGTLTVENQSATQSITATGLDIGYAFAGALFTINTVYN